MKYILNRLFLKPSLDDLLLAILDKLNFLKELINTILNTSACNNNQWNNAQFD